MRLSKQAHQSPGQLFSFSLMACAIGQLGLGEVVGSVVLTMPALVYAQSDDNATRNYDIPAGPLEGALSRFGGEAGILLSFTADLTKGLHSSGLHGHYPAGAGLTILLANTGLQAIRQSNGGYTLAKIPAIESERSELTLPAVIVEASARGDGTTEGTGSYRSTSASTATKLNLSSRETPQSTTVLTRQHMDDQSMNSITDVAQNTPGLFLSNDTGAGRPAYSARGFDIDTVMYDGFPTSVITYVPSTQANLAMFDRAEVVRGATGLVQGAGSPSAAINLVHKRPTADFQGSVTGSVGSWNNKEITTDLSGPLNETGSLRGRVVLSAQDSDSFRTTQNDQHELFYAVGEADLGPTTLLTVAAYRQRDYTNFI